MNNYGESLCSDFRSQEGSQFCRGFGGVGGVLRYQVDTAQFEDVDNDGNSDVWSEDDF